MPLGGIVANEDRRMTETEIYDRLTEIFRDVFDSESLVLSAGMTAKDVRGWDSLGNIRMVLAVEQGFGVRFTTSEVAAHRDVGAFVQTIKSKLDSRPRAS